MTQAPSSQRIETRRHRKVIAKTGLKRKLDPAVLQARNDQVGVFSEAVQSPVETTGFSTTTLQMPDSSGNPFHTFPTTWRTSRLAWNRWKARGITVALDPQRYARENCRPRWCRPFFKFHAHGRHRLDRQRHTHGASSRRSRRQSPPELPAVAARLLPPSLGSSHHPLVASLACFDSPRPDAGAHPFQNLTFARQ